MGHTVTSVRKGLGRPQGSVSCEKELRGMPMCWLCSQVGLAGPSGSGKTVFSERVKALIPGKWDSVSFDIDFVSC
jgi:hypothetical protein